MWGVKFGDTCGEGSRNTNISHRECELLKANNNSSWCAVEKGKKLHRSAGNKNFRPGTAKVKRLPQALIAALLRQKVQLAGPVKATGLPTRANRPQSSTSAT